MTSSSEPHWYKGLMVDGLVLNHIIRKTPMKLDTDVDLDVGVKSDIEYAALQKGMQLFRDLPVIGTKQAPSMPADMNPIEVTPITADSFAHTVLIKKGDREIAYMDTSDIVS